MRKIAVIIGSTSDLKQCIVGLKFLKMCESRGQIKVKGVYIRSQHRNTLDVQSLLTELSRNKIDAIIVGAGWANHLTGCCDAFLRYTLQDTYVRVIGVAFQDEVQARRTQAAVLSITEVPGTQVIFNDYIGQDGFARACLLAAQGDLKQIFLRVAKPAMNLSLEEAIEKAENS